MIHHSPPPLKKLRHDSQGPAPISPSTEQKDQQLHGLCPNLCKLLNEDNIDPSDPRLDKLLSEIVFLKSNNGEWYTRTPTTESAR
jgi:hypothetical protein